MEGTRKPGKTKAFEHFQGTPRLMNHHNYKSCIRPPIHQTVEIGHLKAQPSWRSLGVRNDLING